MYKESLKKHLFSSTWRNSGTHGRIRKILHLTCLNVILNIGPTTIVLVVFAVGHLLQLALVTTSPSLPYVYIVENSETLQQKYSFMQFLVKSGEFGLSPNHRCTFPLAV